MPNAFLPLPSPPSPQYLNHRSKKGEEKRKSEEESEKAEDERKKQMSEEDMQAIEAMPIVILKGFQSKSGSARREALLEELATWAAALAENQVAHVIVVSDNRENAKQLAKGTPYLL